MELDPDIVPNALMCFTRDANPLFLGIPEEHPADYEDTPPIILDLEDDIAARVDRSSWGMAVADWTNSGRPSPFSTGYATSTDGFDEGEEGEDGEGPAFIERHVGLNGGVLNPRYNTVTGQGIGRG